ncbi:PREDICTED: la-related protein 1-like, partial [Condylura cristata]|uniref:la-related protein 1-like n=1 Tax=Condylura cristata TaxID=143302 RepID=UPI000643BA46
VVEMVDEKVRRREEPEKWPLPGPPIVDYSQTDFSQLLNCPEFVPRQHCQKETESAPGSPRAVTPVPTKTEEVSNLKTLPKGLSASLPDLDSESWIEVKKRPRPSPARPKVGGASGPGLVGSGTLLRKSLGVPGSLSRPRTALGLTSGCDVAPGPGPGRSLAASAARLPLAGPPHLRGPGLRCVPTDALAHKLFGAPEPSSIARSLPTTVPESPNYRGARTPRTPRTPQLKDASQTSRFYPVVKEGRTLDAKMPRKRKTRHSSNPPLESHVGWVMDSREHRPRTASVRCVGSCLRRG